jgi:DNA polymerase III delta subunit
LPGSEQGTYEIMDAVGKRNGPEALRLLAEDGGDERGAAPLLYQRIRELLKVALIKSRGLSQPLAATELKLHPFRLKNLWEQASRFNVAELRCMLRELIELQAATVTGRLGKTGQTASMETWVLKRTGRNR